MSATLTLEPRLDLKAVPGLHDQLKDHQGKPLKLDASGVTHLSTPAVQVLLSAAKSWDAEHQPLVIDGVSDAMHAQLRLFGLKATDLSTEGL